VIELEQRRGFLDVLARPDVQLEAIARDVRQGVTGQAGIEDVGHQHHVVPSRRHRQSARAQSARLRLGVVCHEETIALEELAERPRHLQRGAEGLGDRHEQRLRGAPGERDRDRRVESVDRFRLDPDGHTVILTKRANVLRALGDAEVLRHRRRLREELLHQRRELQPREDVVKLRAIGLGALERLEVDVQIEVALDARQLFREVRLVAILFQGLSLGGLLDRVEVLVDAIERAEFLDERLRALLADAGHPGNVVDGVAPDGHHVDHFFRRQTEGLLHALGVVQHLAAGVVEADAVADELEEVLVARGYDDVVAAVARGAGQRADEVVRLPFDGADDRDAEGFQNFVHERDLHDQIVRHRLAVFLVVRELGGARRLLPLIERDGDRARVVVFEQLPQRGDESIDRVRREPCRIRQMADGVVRAVDVVGAVDDEQRGTLLGHCVRIMYSVCHQ